MTNQAFIDGQNLYLGTTSAQKPWRVDLHRFRTYLREKYHVEKAYYFLGYHLDSHAKLYQYIQESGFVLMFRKHHEKIGSIKKGNVDTEIVFHVMKNIAEREKFDQVILVSGDGDYYLVVDFLIKECRLGKVLFPAHKNVSSLYRRLPPQYFDYLDRPGIKSKIISKKRKKKRGSCLGISPFASPSSSCNHIISKNNKNASKKENQT